MNHLWDSYDRALIFDTGADARPMELERHPPENTLALNGTKARHHIRSSECERESLNTGIQELDREGTILYGTALTHELVEAL